MKPEPIELVILDKSAWLTVAGMLNEEYQNYEFSTD